MIGQRPDISPAWAFAPAGAAGSQFTPACEDPQKPTCAPAGSGVWTLLGMMTTTGDLTLPGQVHDFDVSSSR